MMLTEAEAATKRCPLSFGPAPVATITAAPSPSYGSPFGHQFNQPMFQVMPTNCIGSACMAWRWQDSASDPGDRGPYGYCGKAGKP